MLQYSNREEQEAELARVNSEYLEGKRSALKDLRGNEPQEKPKKRGNFYCCLIVLLSVMLCCAVLIYFIMNVKGSLVAGYSQTKEQVQNALPQAQTEVRTSISQGAALVDNTTQAINSMEQTYKKMKGVVDWVSGVYERIKNF